MLKVINILAIAGAILFFTSDTVVAAAEKPSARKQISSISLTPTVGGYLFSGSEALEPTVLYGLKMSYDITGSAMADSLSIDGTINYFNTTAKSGSDKADGYLFRVDAIYSLTHKKKQKLVPFIAVGLGDRLLATTSKTENNLLFNYGIGVKYYLKNFLAFRVDARQLLIYKDVNTRSNYELSAGLTYHFDKIEKKPAAKIIPAREKPKDLPKNQNDKEEEEITPASIIKPEPTVLEKLGGAGAAVVGISSGPDLFEPQQAPQPARAPSVFRPGVIEPRDSSRPETGQAPLRQTITPKAAPAPAPSKPEVQLQSQRMVTAVTVEFDFAKDKISNSYDKRIEVAAAMINSAAHSTVHIEAHADNIGSSAENLAISIRRAHSLKDNLVKLGVNPENITVKGYGFTKPLTENSTAIGRQKNRRAVAVITIQFA